MPPLVRQWLLTLLLGSIFYAGYHRVVHFSDWCYLGTSTFFAAGSSYLVIPLNGWLLRQLAASSWPAIGRWLALLGGTLALFALANLLVLPLLSWPGPGSTWPWGVAALLVAPLVHRQLLSAPQPQ
ncbi:hypothetical protein Q5H93_17450 [Hymenobacter sp. ASUV-10]|uniref:Uncharacterized protein n=1 Tax=Hymenobacter aranciens TaxID=3063996 RepID=A0ABT9BFR7_9BACT|nr:hypothetical protein [Hymenobacter sp. ASUV-10]MDO7876534.1 hypothetical protein [Hymenobacter sp. ASUV-10]